MLTEEELLGSITDEELIFMSRDVLDFHEIGGFHETAPVLDFIEKVKNNFDMGEEEAIHSSLYMLNLEIIERYSNLDINLFN